MNENKRSIMETQKAILSALGLRSTENVSIVAVDLRLRPDEVPTVKVSYDVVGAEDGALKLIEREYKLVPKRSVAEKKDK